MKKLFFLFFVLFFCGCSNKNLVHEHCIRNGTGNGFSTDLEYDIYYQDDILVKLESYESVLSEDKDILDTYYDAYHNIHNQYKDLDYYETKLERNDYSVTSTMIIEYNKIDIDKLIQIEGEEDNIFENKIPLASKWKSFAKKVGTSCSVVEK